LKIITHDGIDAPHKVETTVDSLDTTNELLGLLGFWPKGYHKNRRTSFILGA
jgi:adenylate cyclase class 2